MTVTADFNQRNFLRIQGVFLAIRCLVIAGLGIFAYNFELPIFGAVLVGIAVLAGWFIKTGLICRLSYCFLFASAVWAGVSTAMIIVEQDPIAIAFGLSLAMIDGSIFASTWRRAWL